MLPLLLPCATLLDIRALVGDVVAADGTAALRAEVGGVSADGLPFEDMVPAAAGSLDKRLGVGNPDEGESTIAD